MAALFSDEAETVAGAGALLEIIMEERQIGYVGQDLIAEVTGRRMILPGDKTWAETMTANRQKTITILIDCMRLNSHRRLYRQARPIGCLKQE